MPDVAVQTSGVQDQGSEKLSVLERYVAKWKAAIDKPLKQYRIIRGRLVLAQGDPSAIDRVVNRCLSAVAIYDDYVVCGVTLREEGVAKLILDLITYRGGWLGAEHVRDGFIGEAGTELRAVVGSQHGFNSVDPDGECKSFASRVWAYLAGHNVRVNRRAPVQDSEVDDVTGGTTVHAVHSSSITPSDPLYLPRPPIPVSMKVPIQPPVVFQTATTAPSPRTTKKRGRPAGPQASPSTVEAGEKFNYLKKEGQVGVMKAS